MMKLLLGAILLLPVAGYAVDSSIRLAEELVTLRREVEDSAFQLKERRKRREEESRAHRSRMNELDYEERRLLKRERELMQSIRKTQARIEDINKNEASRKEDCLAAIAALRDAIQSGPPLQKSERLDSISEIERSLTTQILTVYQAWREVASLLEQEVLLRTQVNTTRQSLVIDGQLVPATVVAFGTASVVFETSSGDVGYLRRLAEAHEEGAAYEWKLTQEPFLKAAIEEIMQKSSKGSAISLARLPLVEPIQFAEE